MAGSRITAPDIKIKIAGKEISDHNISHVECMSDLNQPCMAEITLANFGQGGGGGGGGGIMGALMGLLDLVGGAVESKRFSATDKGGADVEIEMGIIGEGTKPVFKGSLSGFVPAFDTHTPVNVNIRAMNALHPLSRERKTRTFVNRKEQDIISEIVSENKLSAKFGKEPPNLMHEHLHQNNMTDLEFLRVRASRTGRNLWVDIDNKTLYFVKYEKDQGPVANLNYTLEGESSLENFTPQMSAAAQVQKVKTHGWDPKKKKEILGEFTAQASPLGSEGGGSSFGDSPELQVWDVPFRTKEEGDLIAESTCTERNMNFITGSATTKGNAAIKLGTIVKMDTADKRFNGKYYVAGVRHSFSHGASGLGGGGGMGGFKTTFKFKRDAGMGS